MSDNPFPEKMVTFSGDCRGGAVQLSLCTFLLINYERWLLGFFVFFFPLIKLFGTGWWGHIPLIQYSDVEADESL